MDFERILGVPFFHSSFHSIMLWVGQNIFGNKIPYLWLWHFFSILWNARRFTIDLCYNQTIGTWHHFFSTLQHAIEWLKLFSLFHKTNCFQIFVLYLWFVGTYYFNLFSKKTFQIFYQRMTHINKLLFRKRNFYQSHWNFW